MFAMHLRYLYLIALLLSLSSVAHSQKVVVSNPIEITAESHYEFIGLFNKQLLLFFEEDRRIDVFAYDKEMKKQWSKQLHMTQKNGQTIGLMPGNNEFHHFYSYRDRDTTFLVHDIYNPQAELKESYFILKSEELGGRFLFNSSTDGQGCLFFQPGVNEKLWTLSYNFHEAMVMWERKFELAERFDRSFAGLQLTSRNELYLLLSTENKSSRKEEHTFIIYHVQPGEEEVSALRVPTPNFLVNSNLMVYDEVNQALNIVGFYTERNLDQSEGVFYFTLSPGQTQINITSYPWTQELKAKMIGASGSRSNGVTGLELKEAILREDGGILLIGEVEKIYQRRASFAERNMYSRGGNWVDFIYEDLLLVSLHPSGEVHWNTVINKRQFSQDDNGLFSSFFVFSNPSMLRILFNDEIKSNNTASSYEVFGTGEVNRSSILSTQYQQLRLRFMESFQYSSNALIIPSEYKGKLKLVQIQF
jgi:hypothetical protein